jgi:hypothetical protein
MDIAVQAKPSKRIMRVERRGEMVSVLLFLGVGVGEELLGSAECTEALAVASSSAPISARARVSKEEDDVWASRGPDGNGIFSSHASRARADPRASR